MARPAQALKGVLLAFTAGYVDTVGFVALFGLFTAHVTGNFVLIGSELVHPTRGVLLKFLAFPAFVVAVAATRMLTLAIEARKRAAREPLLLVQCALLAACMLCGWRASPIADSGAPWVLATGILCAAAMGVQNAASRLTFSELTPTTVMTGNVTQFVIDLVDLLRGAADVALRSRFHKLLWSILAFGAGAVIGALGYVHLGFWSLALPMALLAAIASSRD